MPQPVDVLLAAVERPPLVVRIAQEIEPRDVAVRSGIMVAVVDRMNGEPRCDYPQRRQQGHKLVRRNVLKHLVRAGTVDVPGSIRHAMRRAVRDAEVFEIVPSAETYRANEDPVGGMLDQVQPRQAVDVRSNDAPHPKPSQCKRNRQITSGPDFQYRCRSSIDVSRIIFDHTPREFRREFSVFAGRGQVRVTCRCRK